MIVRPVAQTETKIKAGDVLYVTGAASVQFQQRPITFRLIRVKTDWTTFDGWVWLDGYQLDKQGNANVRRSIFVQWAGLRLVPQPRTVAPEQTGQQRRPNSRPVPAARTGARNRPTAPR